MTRRDGGSVMVGRRVEIGPKARSVLNLEDDCSALDVKSALSRYGLDLRESTVVILSDAPSKGVVSCLVTHRMDRIDEVIGLINLLDAGFKVDRKLPASKPATSRKQMRRWK